ncbi:hypothetical protein SAMN05421847_2119 [Halpernia humi]|uniref:Uncharacterized protein n=1 Tax=Halpernia humi TaxID=493375 RepID=A0A1H5ZQC8_9FLAO|nr:hypothetical protein [Halpernia humi]SEG37945.1 hypothetical protein SAMN05421847_2119 [Halpernia humi]
MKTKITKLASVLFLIIFCLNFNTTKAQLPCTDKGYFYITGTDSFHKTVVVSNIIKGDIFWCNSDGKKMLPDNPKMQLFIDAIKAKNPELQTINVIIPDNSGYNTFNGTKLSNDYESIKKVYDLMIKNIKPYTLIKVVLKDEDFE